MKMKEERHDKRRGEKIERREERRQEERREERREAVTVIDFACGKPSGLLESRVSRSREARCKPCKALPEGVAHGRS